MQHCSPPPLYLPGTLRFGLVLGSLLLTIVSSATPVIDEKNENDPGRILMNALFTLEAVILGHYSLEFSIRVWSAGCFAKYKGFSYLGL